MAAVPVVDFVGRASTASGASPSLSYSECLRCLWMMRILGDDTLDSWVKAVAAVDVDASVVRKQQRGPAESRAALQVFEKPKRKTQRMDVANSSVVEAGFLLVAAMDPERESMRAIEGAADILEVDYGDEAAQDKSRVQEMEEDVDRQLRGAGAAAVAVVVVAGAGHGEAACRRVHSWLLGRMLPKEEGGKEGRKEKGQGPDMKNKQKECAWLHRRGTTTRADETAEGHMVRN